MQLVCVAKLHIILLTAKYFLVFFCFWRVSFLRPGRRTPFFCLFLLCFLLCFLRPGRRTPLLSYSIILIIGGERRGRLFFDLVEEHQFEGDGLLAAEGD